MKLRMKGAVAAAASIALIATGAGVANAYTGTGPLPGTTTPPWETGNVNFPSAPGFPAVDPNSKGGVLFYDASGNQIAGGSLSSIGTYLATNGTAARPGTTTANASFAVPNHLTPEHRQLGDRRCDRFVVLAAQPGSRRHHHVGHRAGRDAQHGRRRGQHHRHPRRHHQRRDGRLRPRPAGARQGRRSPPTRPATTATTSTGRPTSSTTTRPPPSPTVSPPVSGRSSTRP